MGACNCDCYNELMAELDENSCIDKINRVNSESIKHNESKLMAKLRDVNACLKTLCFMLKQYTLPDEENNVAKFETTQDMARYFKIMADMCLKASEFE